MCSVSSSACLQNLQGAWRFLPRRLESTATQKRTLWPLTSSQANQLWEGMASSHLGHTKCKLKHVKVILWLLDSKKTFIVHHCTTVLTSRHRPTLWMDPEVRQEDGRPLPNFSQFGRAIRREPLRARAKRSQLDRPDRSTCLCIYIYMIIYDYIYIYIYMIMYI